jgi:small subunit ribosomal protein S20
LPNKRSAAKQVRVQERRRLRNQSVRSATRTFVRKAEAEVRAHEAETAPEAVRLAVSALDRAARKGVIHPNAAARKKSRLMRKMNAAFAPAAS